MGRTQPCFSAVPLFLPRILSSPLRVSPPSFTQTFRAIQGHRVCQRSLTAILRYASGRGQTFNGLFGIPSQRTDAEVSVRGPYLGDDPPRSREHVRDRVQRELGNEQTAAIESGGGYRWWGCPGQD